MEDTAAVFLRHLYSSAAGIDVDDMIGHIQNLHGLLQEVKFEETNSKQKKIRLLITGLRQRHPTALLFVLDYLLANGFRTAADSIFYDMTRWMLSLEERNLNGPQNVVVQAVPIDGNRSPAVESANTDQEVQPTVTVTSELTVDSIKMDLEKKSIPSRDVAVMTEIENGGVSKDIVVDKMAEMYSKQKETRIVQISGKSIKIFNPIDSSISRVSKDLEDFVPVQFHQCHLINKNQVLIIGGIVAQNYLQHKKYNQLKQTSYLNLNTFAVKPGPCLPAPIAEAASSSLNGILYICGGLIDNYPATAACYKLMDNKWVAISSLNIGRCGHTMSALDGHLYVIGGKNEKTRLLQSVECYDPLTDKWIELESQMNEARCFAASLVHRGQIWVTGGGYLRCNDSESCCKTEIFDPITETWSCGPRLNHKRRDHSMVELCGKMYAVGGFSNSKTMEVFNDDADKWEMVNHNIENGCYRGGLVAIE